MRWLSLSVTEGIRLKPTIRLGRIAGIEIGIHYSWFAVLALVTWSLADQFFPSIYHWSDITYWSAAFISALLLFVSVLIHELAHSLVAKARGFEVEGITLFLLGGVSKLEADAGGPKDEFVISAVGPAASLALSAIFWLTLQAFQDRTTPFSAIFAYLWLINLLLAIFNLLPAFPLDGGRILRSVLWGATHNFDKATTVAARGGQLFGFIFASFGIYQVLQDNFISGLWLGFIGWFLFTSASSSQQQTKTEAPVKQIFVKDVMDRHPGSVEPDLLMSEAVYEHFLRYGTKALLVCEGDQLTGILTLTDVKRVPQGQWNWVKVSHAMTRMPLWSVSPDDELSQALNVLAEHSLNQAPVLEGNRLVGMLSRAEIIQSLHSSKEPGTEQARSLTTRDTSH
ncbi:MAG: site-2 protease family protein [Chloroflexi bacterium]|nr:site-2 protease family protein [Chloroflexota bacterium]